MIHLHDISFAYHEQAPLLNLDLQVQKGEAIVLCGQSGSGKSTLLKILNGLIPELYEGVLSGRGTILGADFQTQEFTVYVRNIGVVFQNPKTQFFTNDVYSELAFSMENYGIPQAQIVERIHEVTHTLQLEHLVQRSMFQLSGGQKQLVAFASACMLEHPLFLLDEPSSNLDEQTIQQLKSYLAHLKQQGFTLIIAEHRLHYLTDLADRYLIMEEGRIVHDYSSTEMFNKSADQITQLGLRSLDETQLTRRSEAPVPKVAKGCRLTLQGLEYRYRKQVACSVNIPALELDNQSVTGIIGPNGAGKSTFLKLISGLLKPQKGVVAFNGHSMSARQLIKESFVVMQDVNLQLFFETVEKELTVKATYLEEFETVVHLLNLEPLLQRHPQTLSGGEKQRVAIATALLSGKRIILFDEPTSGLDLKHMNEVSQTIQRLHQRDILILIITHDKEFIDRTCQRVLRFEEGSIVEDYYTKL